MHPQLIALDVAGRPLVIGSYGALLCAAIALAAASLLFAGRALKLDLGACIAAAGTAVFGGLVGAVGAHGLGVAIDHGLGTALARPGLSMFGALLGAAGGLLLAARKLALPALELVDRALPGLVLAQAVARLGCFFGGCCAGRAGSLSVAGLPLATEPLPLYEVGALLLLAGYWAVANARTAVPVGGTRRSEATTSRMGGAPAASPMGREGREPFPLHGLQHLALYAALRFALDGLRAPDAGGDAHAHVLGASQWLAAGVLLGALCALHVLGGRRAFRRAAVALALAGSAAAWTVAAQGTLALVQGSEDAPLIRAGSFEMGSDSDDVEFAIGLCRAYTDDDDACQPEVFSDEQPRHSVWLGPYRLDRTEVSRRAYQRCVQHGVCTPARVADLDARVALPEHPVTGVSFAQAQRYCGWLGGRLPSEAEWERGARGSSGRRFPWGQHWNSRVANHGTLGPGGVQPDGFLHAAPVLAFADGKSAYGLLNMAGNVWELTADRYDHDYYSSSERVDPRGPSQGTERVIRGGSWRSVPHLLRVTQRGALAEQESRPDVGFRCAYNVD